MLSKFFPCVATIMVFITSHAAASQEMELLFEEVSHQAAFKLVRVADDLATPWDFEFLPDNRIMVTEWGGAVRLIEDGAAGVSLQGTPTVLHTDEYNGGLLGVVAHPNFHQNQLVYFCHLHGEYNSNVSRISRGRLSENRIEGLEVIFEGNDLSKETFHSGCRLLWDDNGQLYAMFGDRRHLPTESQNLNSTTGTIIRINDDGSIPEDNPFVHQDGARPEIWAYGVRNVQGAVMHPETREIWFSEHGSLGGDEVNILKRGANYGWPIATYGIDYDGTPITNDQELPGVEEPLEYWRPSTAPSGLAFYTGDDFPNWRGDLFMGSLAARRVLRMEVHGENILFQEPLLGELDTRIRQLRMGPDGYLYLITDADPGELYRIEPVTP